MRTPAVLPRHSADTLRKTTVRNPTIPSQPPYHHHNHNRPVFQTFAEQKTRIFSLLDTRCTSLTHLKQIHPHICLLGFHQNSYVITKLIRTLTRLNSAVHGYPSAVFRQTRHPNAFLWTAMVRGHVVNRETYDAVVLYERMRRSDVAPTSLTFCALLKGCALTDDVALGRQFHGQVVKFGGLSMEFFLHAGNSLIAMYVKCGVLGCARKVFDEMTVRDGVSRTSLIAAYAKVGELEGARELFDELEVKDEFVWSAMMAAYAQNARPKECLELFEMMQGCGVEVDEYTLASVISACGQLGTAKHAACIREIVERLGCGPERNVVIGSALVDMYSKCGRVDEAFEVFRVMREKGVYAYSSMIMGLAVHGRADAAMELFYDMERKDIRPNHVTFIGVLTACSHAGMVEEGRRLFERMEETYSVVPAADHYTCMVDLLGRSGHLEEALSVANSLQSHPHGGVWGALLGACNIHNNPDIAEIAAEHLFELEPNGIGNYVLLFNILASAGRWNRSSNVQKLMNEKGLKKYPARSWVEGKNGCVHEFFAGNMTHPIINEIRLVLQDLLAKLELNGYQFNLASVSYDLSEDEKKEILMSHSEKLALAFELLTTGSDHTIRIMKNLRICEDCHGFMCGASKITGREIVVRDNMRFHHFSDGVCSCGNFW